MRFLKRFTGTLIPFLLMSFQGWAETPLTLEEASRILLQANPLLEAASADTAAAHAAHRAARKSRLPRVELQERIIRGNNPVFVFGSLLEQNQFTQQNFALDRLNDPSALTNFRTSAAIQLPLFSQRRIQTAIRSARAGQEQAGAAEELTRQGLLLELVSDYFQVMLADEAVEVNRSSVETARVEVTRMRNLVEEDLVVKSDLLAMEVQLAEFQQNLIQAESEAESARAQLRQILNQDPATRYDLQTPLRDRAFSVEDLGALRALAKEQRPELVIAEAQREQARQDLRAARGKWQPSVQLFAEVGSSSPDLHSGSSDFAVGGSLNFSLLEPGRRERIERAREGLRAAEARYQAELNRVEFEVVQALEAFRSARQRVVVAKTSVSQAEETLRIVQERLGAGLTTVTESLRAQTALQRARLNLLAARFENYIGFARVRFATGRMVDIDPFTN